MAARALASSFAMSGVIDSIERAQLRRVPLFDAGDRLRVHFQVVEGTRRRTQVFEGVVIKRQGSGARETFTVRDRKSTRLNSSHANISYAVFCLKKKIQRSNKICQ